MNLTLKWEPERRMYNMDAPYRQQQELERKRNGNRIQLATEVTEEELRQELALLGFSHVPQERLMEFKQDLEQLMRQQVAAGDPDIKENQNLSSESRNDEWSEPIQANTSFFGEGARARPPRGKVTMSGREACKEPPAGTKSAFGAAFCSATHAQTDLPRGKGCSPGNDIWSALPAWNNPSQTESLQGVPFRIRNQAWTEIYAPTDPVPLTTSAFSQGNMWIGCPVNSARTGGLPLSSPYSEDPSITGSKQVATPKTKERPSSCGEESNSGVSTACSSPHEEPADGWQRPAMKRKVLRRSEDGRVQISDESNVSEVESEICWGQEPWKGESDLERLEMTLVPPYFVNHRQEQEERDRLKSFIRPRLIGNHQKKTDPVAKYQQYKRGWDAFQAPGEKDRKDLRWDMREQMLYKAPQPHRRTPHVYIPNNYVVPTEKKRSTLRWGVRYDLANGIIPQTKIYPSLR
ncbi:hydrolethalus syndrome protein 1 [Rhinatrema bivittatum]|uniref:hydrolethalus syndrome protein 1 n=1 Tax=Rhinatrema bivittatum TaxID=194408 RepID=UPI00112CC54F|nr:hydrolethalus syndrome protein 1 [Rhinatrema bivittatum]